MLFSVCVAATLAIGLTGCKKQEESASEQVTTETKSTTSKALDAVKDTANQVKEGAQKAATEIKEGAEKAAQEVKDKAIEVKDDAVKLATDVKEKAQNLVTSDNIADNIIAKAKAFVAEGKYQEALDKLKELTGLDLTEMQQKLVNDLKEQIKQAMSKEALKSGASAVGNLFNK